MKNLIFKSVGVLAAVILFTGQTSTVYCAGWIEEPEMPKSLIK